MTECNTTRMEFSRVKSRKVTLDFNGGRLTTDAGVLLLREVDRRTGLIDAINDCRVMVLIFSSSSNESQQVKRELERALAKLATDAEKSCRNLIVAGWP